MPKTATALTRTYIEDLHNRKFITEAQRDAYISKDQKALEKANDEALAAGISKSLKYVATNPARRTSSNTKNAAGNHGNTSNSGKSARNARTTSQKTQTKRATATQQEKAWQAFDSIKTTMEKRGFIRILPAEVRDKKGKSAILNFLNALQENTSGSHSKVWKKYQCSLSKASKCKKESDEYELVDFEDNDEQDRLFDIIVSLKKNKSDLGDFSINIQWVSEAGAPRTETLGTGKQTMYLAYTPDEKFVAFFQIPK